MASPKPNEIAAAYVLDRAYQYRESSGIHHALVVVACALWDGEADIAFAHGELDDLIKGMASRRGQTAPPEQGRFPLEGKKGM